MRMRHKKNVPERLIHCGNLFLPAPSSLKGGWPGLFGNANPIMTEIGCGKGAFIIQLAQKYPNINFVAAERCLDALVLAVEKAHQIGIPNLRFMDIDAAVIEDVFAPGECRRIFLNFSDPWPKRKHAKRRLTHINFLTKYAAVLSTLGEIHFKTDNLPFFLFSLDEFQQNGWRLQNITFDLHRSGFPENFLTEYETFFSSKGVPICRLEARRP